MYSGIYRDSFGVANECICAAGYITDEGLNLQFVFKCPRGEVETSTKSIKKDIFYRLTTEGNGKPVAIHFIRDISGQNPVYMLIEDMQGNLKGSDARVQIPLTKNANLKLAGIVNRIFGYDALIYPGSAPESTSIVTVTKKEVTATKKVTVVSYKEPRVQPKPKFKPKFKPNHHPDRYQDDDGYSKGKKKRKPERTKKHSYLD